MLSVTKPVFTKDIVDALQEVIYECLKKAMSESLDRAENTDTERSISKKDMIEAFADAGKKAVDQKTVSKLVDAIDTYIKSAGVTIINTPAALVSPMGPVTGVITIKPSDVTIS